MGATLLGLETEYGLEVEGAGPEEQAGHSRALVESHQGPCHVGWDYRHESPRRDLRGFTLAQLAHDVRDALFDRPSRDVPRDSDRADRVLANGARFYNDHGHPEYSTPECRSPAEAARLDGVGDWTVMRAAEAYATKLGRRVRVFKHNSDGHGASYGTHENYLAERRWGFARLYRAVLPVLVARPLLTGAGKPGSEAGPPCRFQCSQRADFLTEAANAETLANRPVFNTRDEPHADAARWIRLHVISGDANLSPSCTARKLALVRIAIRLLELGAAPDWEILEPGKAIASVSRTLDGSARLALASGAWTTPVEVLRSYTAAARERLDRAEPGDAELVAHAEQCDALLDVLPERPPEFARAVEWAAKLAMLEQYFDSGWDETAARSLDLAFCQLDTEEGLYPALAAAGLADPPAWLDAPSRLDELHEATRAVARSVAVRRFPQAVAATSWGRITLHTSTGARELELRPDACYGDAVRAATSPDELAAAIEDAP